MIWLRWIFSPVGRIAGAVGMGFSLLLAAYLKGRGEGKAALKQRQNDETMRRLRASIEADARGRERIARGELLQDDGFRRD